MMIGETDERVINSFCGRSLTTACTQPAIASIQQIAPPFAYLTPDEPDWDLQGEPGRFLRRVTGQINVT